MKIWFQDDIPAEASTGVNSIPTDEQKELIHEAVRVCLDSEDFSSEVVETSALSLSFVSPEEIRELNREYRDVDRVTDVLSFPMFEDPGEIARAAGEEEILLGDVVICREKIRDQAEEYGHSETRELIYLFVHSMLHLLGYDHMEEKDKKAMRAREEQIMEQLGIGR